MFKTTFNIIIKRSNNCLQFTLHTCTYKIIPQILSIYKIKSFPVVYKTAIYTIVFAILCSIQTLDQRLSKTKLQISYNIVLLIGEVTRKGEHMLTIHLLLTDMNVGKGGEIEFDV